MSDVQDKDCVTLLDQTISAGAMLNLKMYKWSATDLHTLHVMTDFSSSNGPCDIQQNTTHGITKPPTSDTKLYRKAESVVSSQPPPQTNFTNHKNDSLFYFESDRKKTGIISFSFRAIVLFIDVKYSVR